MLHISKKLCPGQHQGNTLIPTVPQIQHLSCTKRILGAPEGVFVGGAACIVPISEPVQAAGAQQGGLKDRRCSRIPRRGASDVLDLYNKI